MWVWQTHTDGTQNEPNGEKDIPCELRLYKVGNSSMPHLIEDIDVMRNPIQVGDGGQNNRVHRLQGLVKKVKVTSVNKGTKENEFFLFYGLVDRLTWDPRKFRWKWIEEISIMKYSTKVGRDLLRRHHVIPSVVERKWADILPQSFKLRWSTLWMKTRVRKERG